MDLTANQLDALTEMINIGVGRAASVLNSMLRSHVRLHLPIVSVLSAKELQEKTERISKSVFSAVRLGFKGPFAGSASLVFPVESAAKLVVLLTGDEGEAADLDEIRIGTLTEVGNIVLNGVMGAVGNEIRGHIFYSVPIHTENPVEMLLDSAQDSGSTVIWVQTQFAVEQHQIDGEIILVFEVGSLDLLKTAIDQVMGV